MTETSKKILIVDDEPNVLQACERLLHNRFETEAVGAGAEALEAIQRRGPYAIVLSDMRMPHMDGLQLLTRVKALAPDTVRIMLTGNADVQTALMAVNEGNIFRFLTKPCSKQTLVNALTEGLRQYGLVTSEKEILEKTLAGSLRVLTEVLSVACPAGFGRAMRLRRYMGHIATKMSLANRWKYELAAMLSQLGCVTMAPETIEAMYAGQTLSPLEQAKYDTHPKIAWELLRDIPRLESVAWMIGHQNQSDGTAGDISDRELAEKRFGAELLQATLAFDQCVRRGVSRTEAAFMVGRQHSDLDPRVMMALVEVEPEAEHKEVRSCSIEQISENMVIEKDVRNAAGQLVIARNQEVTPSVIQKLKNYHEAGAIAGEVMVSAAHALPSSS